MKSVNLALGLAVSLSGLTGCSLRNLAQQGETQRFAEQQTEYWAIEAVQDGSTFEGSKDGTQEQISLCGITAPGLDHSLWETSKTQLEQLLAQSPDGIVGVVPVGRNPAGDLVAEVFVPTKGAEEIHLNSQMILEGLAYVDVAVNDCRNSRVNAEANDTELINVQNIRRLKWKQNNTENIDVEASSIR